MKSLPVLWFLVALSALGGLRGVAAQKKDKPKPARTYAINVGTGIQHWLLIYSDGSGTVGYGAGGSYQGYFKAGAFDVEQVTKQLKGLPLDEKGEWQSHYYFDFESERKGPEKPGPKYYTQDRKLIPSLFEKAITASGKKKEDFPKGFGQLKTSPGHRQ